MMILMSLKDYSLNSLANTKKQFKQRLDLVIKALLLYR